MSTSRWGALAGPDRGESEQERAARYAARFAELAAAGADVHGEARYVAALVPAGARVLDAGCGTGRVAIRLAELGYDVTGVDLDAAMLAQARAAAPHLPWVHADLGSLGLVDRGQPPFDLVVAAGNVVPLVAPGSEAEVVAALARHLRPGGLLVAGFGLDAEHLPAAVPPVALADYDAWCARAGLRLERRHAGWDGEPFPDQGARSTGGSGAPGAPGYAVSVHRRPR
ncbi:MAG TPA: class I SAM-dependent methyltransferase [Motilibacteraceae bacterium]|nr:class I SAM-dependent methyltransferase [Motilibacteraceae bacterium]